jgi:ubiquinone/menaquinone biosynthesis C-methylase UbiE
MLCGMAAVQNACAGPFGAFYDFWIERERVARAVGATLWGMDVRPMYADMERVVSGAPDGAVLLDVPCGGGVAFRWLRPAQQVRYIAIDLDEDMLARARRRSRQQVEVVQADMRALPFDDASIDVALSYSGLHMIPDPDRAIAELGRVVKPGGHLAGSSFVAPGTLRQRLIFGIGARTGHVRPSITEAELRRWLLNSGFSDLRYNAHNGFAVFGAAKRRP